MQQCVPGLAPRIRHEGCELLDETQVLLHPGCMVGSSCHCLEA